MQSIAPSENAEIDRWLDEMKRAEVPSLCVSKTA